MTETHAVRLRVREDSASPFVRVGLEFCGHVVALAPRTRARRGVQVELTAASMIVRVDRLASVLKRASQSALSPEQHELATQLATRVLEILGEWRARARVDPALAMASEQTRESGERFLRLLAAAPPFADGAVEEDEPPLDAGAEVGSHPARD